MLQEVFLQIHKRTRNTLLLQRETRQKEGEQEDWTTMKTVHSFLKVLAECMLLKLHLHFLTWKHWMDEPKMNSISDAFMSSDVEKKCIFENMMKKFVEEFALASDNKTHECDDQISSSEQLDRIKAYALNYLKHFLLFEDLNDGVKEGDGPRLATLSKVLLLHFKAVLGFNSYAIEMITNIAQNSVLLSECLSNQCIWAATASWKGGIRKKHGN